MTAAELIEKLKKLPPDAVVLTWNAEFGVGIGIKSVSFQNWTDPFTQNVESGLVIK